MHTIAIRCLCWVTVGALAGSTLSAQAAPTPTDTPSIFAPLTLAPAPSATRLANGAPGPKYWQNHADYELKGTLDTATKTVRGSMVLRYTNNSPNVLKEFWFQTEKRSEVFDRLDQVVKGKPVAIGPGEHPGKDPFVLHVVLAEPLQPGKTTTFQAEWHFSADKSRDGALYQITQWYPRPYVYDDVKGWNTESLSLGGEYYLEYGDIQMSVTVPAGYIVAATGTLDNPKEVLTPTQISRLALAAKADTVVRIVTADELKSGAARPTHDGMLTWKFHAKNVRDAVWSVSPEYQWDATHWKNIIAQAYYRPAAAKFWSDGADEAKMSIQEYSERWFPYPYPQISGVEGPEYGMEYPMLSMVGTTASQSELYGVLTHEIGHNWFPMIVGSNERMHTWMDEGFNTFINTFSEARRYPKEGDQASRFNWDMNRQDAVLEDGTAIGNAGYQYRKTGAVLELLRRGVLGPELFDKAFRTYIQRWAYKHPTPMDFFRTMEDVSGQNLVWFWREGFLESPSFDQAIDSVSQTAQGTDTHVTVTYGNKTRAVLPIIVRFTFNDSTTQDMTYPADVWRANPAAYTVSYTFKKPVSRIALDPNKYLPDAKPENNSWTAK